MNKNIRRKDRSVTDLEQIKKVVDDAKILHLGLLDDDFPYIVPLHYGYEYDAEADCFTFYIHGAKVGHKIDLILKNQNVCIELETDVELDPAGDIACQYGSFYSSFIGQGNASIIEDIENKKHALNMLMINQTGMAFEFTEQMVQAVAVIKVEIANYTVKARVKNR